MRHCKTRLRPTSRASHKTKVYSNECHLLKTKQFFVLQTAFCICLSIIFGVSLNKHIGISMFVGNVTCIVPTAYHAKKIFAQTGAQSAGRIIQATYKGEIQKLCLAAIFCLIAFLWLHVIPWAFFLGLMLAQSAFVWAPSIVNMCSEYLG